MTINVSLLIHELKDAGLPVASVSERAGGAFDYTRKLTIEEQVTADEVVAMHDPDKLDNLKDAIVTKAQSAAGVALTNLTAAQIKALFAVILWKAGGVAPDGTVKALGEWN